MSDTEIYSILLHAVRGLNDVKSWTGKTHVIKSLYIASTKVKLPFDFVLYKHGPYSFDANDAIDCMSAVDLLNITATPPYGVQLKPGRFAAVIDAAVPEDVSLWVNRAIDAVGSSDVKQMEAFATSIWVSENRPPGDESAWLESVKELKPHLDNEIILEGIQKAKTWATTA